jgi:hypothetical protein
MVLQEKTFRRGDSYRCLRCWHRCAHLRPLINWLILTYDWQVTYRVLALIFFTIVITASFIIRHPRHT